jgi:hypothetical protein
MLNAAPDDERTIRMSKHPDEHEPIRPLSKEERAARKAFREIEAVEAMSDH